MHTYRPVPFPPWMIASEVPLVVLAAVFGNPWLLLAPLSGFVGAWLGNRWLPDTRGLTLSAEGIRIAGLSIPWEGIERIDRRHALWGGHRLVLRQPISYSRWLNPWKTRYIGLAAYERPVDVGADIARWAPQLVSDPTLLPA